jgi:hypothetical protein
MECGSLIHEGSSILHASYNFKLACQKALQSLEHDLMIIRQ